MYTTRIFQEATQENGVGGLVWVALLIFFLMVFLGWWVSSKGWLNKDEPAPNPEHGHDSHETEHPHSEGHQAANMTMEEKTAPAAQAAMSAESAPETKMAMDEQPKPAGMVSMADDLTLLEGIGPKVAKVLAGIGITTFAGLSKADYTSVKEALAAAGYKYMDPAGWIDQAVLAAKGDTEGLKKLQDSLKGGRKVA